MSLISTGSRLIGVACVAFSAWSCDAGTSSSAQTAPDTSGFQKLDASELFAWDHVPSFEATLPPERWSYLRSHALDESYEPAEVRFEGQSLGTVGLRFKGSIGTLKSCVDQQGNLTCAKLSMKLGFDEYRPETRFFGLKRLNLHAMSRDDSKLHERLGYDLYRSVGVHAPRSAWALLKVNGEALGLFSMVEQIDGRFTADRFPKNGDGNLYKEAWPVHAEPRYYQDRLETEPPDAAAAQHEVAIALGSELSATTDTSQLRAALARTMDLDYLARYMAVDDAIVNVDGVTATYTGSDPHSYQNHNFYLYLEQSQPRLWLVPWDLDATFLPRGDFEAVPRWNGAQADCSRGHLVWGITNVVSPSCDPLFQALAVDPSAYRAAVDALLAGPFSETALQASIEKHAAFIEQSVATDAQGPSSWRAAVTALSERVPLLRQRLQRVRDGLALSPFSLSLSKVNDFEEEDATSIALGAVPLCNSHSTVSATLRTSLALSGMRDVRLDFVYRNEGEPPARPWDQWIYFPLRFEDAPRALSTLSGIRLLLRADTPRTLRIDLDSSEYEASIEGIKFGWDVDVGPSASEVELRFADAKVPLWARPTSDMLSRVLARVEGLAFHPYCNGRDAAGFLPAGGSDPGFLELDQIELF